MVGTGSKQPWELAHPSNERTLLGQQGGYYPNKRKYCVLEPSIVCRIYLSSLWMAEHVAPSILACWASVWSLWTPTYTLPAGRPVG